MRLHRRLPDAGRTRHWVKGRSRIEVGRYTYGFEHMNVLQWGEGFDLRIGSFCSIAEGLCVFLGGNHRVDWATTFPFGHIFQDDLGGEGIVGHPASRGDVVIGNDVWIGRGTTILSGVTIGDGAVIAANSTVTRDVGRFEVWGGNPATRIKPRFPEAVIEELVAMAWWDWDIVTIRQVAPLLSQPPTLEGLRQIARIAAGPDERAFAAE